MIKLTRLLKIKLGPKRSSKKIVIFTEINRILEDGNNRLLEDGNKRLMENST